MSNPMKTFVTDDGRRFLIPGDAQRPVYDHDFYHCECHAHMGNDFYFLPMGSCLRKDKKCDNLKGQVLAK